MDVSVISIGTMAANELWGESEPVRTGHATTVLIRTGDAAVLVDPGLPGPALKARLSERADLKPGDITHVFLTSFHPETRRGLTLFEDAEWLISEMEREAVGGPLASDLKRLAESGLLQDPDADDRALVASIEQEIALLQRFRPAPDAIVPGVDLFPLYGVTPGLAGLFIPSGRGDLLICGDAVPTAEHVELGRVPTRCADADAARASLLEAIEIADLLIPGRDNLMVNPVRRLFAGPGIARAAGE